MFVARLSNVGYISPSTGAPIGLPVSNALNFLAECEKFMTVSPVFVGQATATKKRNISVDWSSRSSSLFAGRS